MLALCRFEAILLTIADFFARDRILLEGQGMLRRLRGKIRPDVLRKIYLSAVQPTLEYACAVWSGGPTAKLVTLHETFCWRHNKNLPALQSRFEYHTLILFSL